MKRVITAIVCLMALMASNAAVPYDFSLVITKTNQEEICYKFASIPVATFENDDMIITTYDPNDKVTVTYPMDEVANMHFVSTPAGIEEIEGAGKQMPTFAVDNNNLYAGGLPAGVEVSIYTISGLKAAAGITDADGSATVNISSLAAGVYAVSAHGNSFKFIKR